MKLRAKAMKLYREAKQNEEQAEKEMNTAMQHFHRLRDEYHEAYRKTREAEAAARKVPPGSIVEVFEDYEIPFRGKIIKGFHEVTGGDGKRITGRIGLFDPDKSRVVWTPHDGTPIPDFIKPQRRG